MIGDWRMSNATGKKPKFTIMPLFYGDYQDLAKRCLSSILSLPDLSGCEIRAGSNTIGDETRQYLDEMWLQFGQLNMIHYSSGTNVGKYPMMRRMLHDPSAPVESEYVIWFDDDSYIKHPTDKWLSELEAVMQTCDMCGQLMAVALSGGQPQWIQTQPWYKGKKFVRGQAPAADVCWIVPTFAVGGWWCAKTSMLKTLDWPPQNIHHRGGDYMLGEAMRQNDYKLVNYRKGVVINAALGSDRDTTSPRRGLDPTPVGVDFVPSATMMIHEATKEVDPKLLDYTNI